MTQNAKHLLNFVRYRVVEFTDVVRGNHLFIPTDNSILMNDVMLIGACGILNVCEENKEAAIKFLDSTINSKDASRKRKS